jgi:glycosyltransferase involved in cell wall biosynthesis
MDNKRPIIWMIDGLGPGGAEQLLPATLKSLKDAGLNIRVCALGIKNGNPIASDLERLGLPVDLVLVPNLRQPLNLLHIWRYLRLHKPQLLHTQLAFADILGTLTAKILRLPTVSTLHTLDMSNKKGSSNWRLKLRWFILRHFTDQVIAVSEKTRLHHIQTAGLPAAKLITLYNGIELSHFASTGAEQRARTKQALNLPETGKIITTVAVLREPKGIQFMLQALPAILQKIADAHYLIIGDGAYKTPLLEQVKTLGLQESVTFAGHRTDIPALLDCTDLFVLPTLVDALPTVLIETLAAEKPIVASNVGGIPEIVENGVNGLLVPPREPLELAKACIKVLENRDLANEFIMAGREKVQQQFDVQVQSRKLIKIYEEILANHGN